MIGIEPYILDNSPGIIFEQINKLYILTNIEIFVYSFVNIVF